MFSVTENTALQDEHNIPLSHEAFTLKFCEGLVFDVSCGAHEVAGRLLCSGGEVRALLDQTVCCGLQVPVAGQCRSAAGTPHI